jgi:outer membrane protein assembly factor BamD
MRMQAFSTLLLALILTGCSSGTLSSMPWSRSAPVVDPTAESLLAEGNKYLEEKRYARAIDAFTKIKTEHPFSPLVTEVELKIADAHFLNEQYVEAVNAFKEFQTLHPTSEHIPFVVLRLGQAHFNQFTDVNRDQKNTEIAKGYFEAVLANHASSPYAAEAKEKLAKCNGILAQHDFNIAEFYFKQEKYPAARDRFEEIVRKYRGTPMAGRSLFYLGESYRLEKNNVKAALAYEALLEHYPEDPLAAPARTQLAQIEKNKQDPLAMLLMRDRRPVIVAEAADAKGQAKAAGNAKEPNNLLTKTEIVYEAPGVERSLFSKVVDKVNPFSSSGDDSKKDDSKKKEPPSEEKPKSAVDLLVKKKAPESESSGFFASLWPFGGSNSEPTKEKPEGETLVTRIDSSLKDQGIDATSQAASLKTPAIDLPDVEDMTPKAQATDNTKLLEQIDSNLKKEGKNPTESPAPPEVAEAFKDPEVAQAAIARAQPKPESEQSAVASGLLSSIDQKLKGQGVEPGKFEPAPVAPQGGAKPKAPPKEVNLEPKRVVEKGPLFLSPGQVPSIEQSSTGAEQKEGQKAESAEKAEEQATREIPKSALVRGPQPPQTTTPAKPAERSQSTSNPDNETTATGAFDQLKQDLEGVGKLLNPFSW